MSTNGKRRATETPFKHRKAKVGKRAQTKPNETSTTFASASIHVAKQSIQRESTEGLVSNNGKSVTELIIQLRHPAASARVSAAQGLCHIARSFGVRLHLHNFLRAFSKCLVDEEKDVRKLGLSLLTTIGTKESKVSLMPFLGSLVAYTCSALNSLDSRMRLDGTRAVILLTSIFSSSLNGSISLILPPFVVLLAEKKTEDLEVVLEALVAILSACNDDQQGTSKHQGTLISDVDFKYDSDGRSKNCFLIQKKIDRYRRNCQPAISMNMLQSSAQTFSNRTSHNLPKGLVMDLHFKIRDIILEMVDEDTEVSRKNPSSRMDLFEAAALAFSLAQELAAVTSLECDDQYSRVLLQSSRAIMEKFPFRNNMQPDDTAVDCDRLNATIWKAIQGTVKYFRKKEDKQQAHSWVRVMEIYWLKKLRKSDDEKGLARCLNVLTAHFADKEHLGVDADILDALKDRFFSDFTDGLARKEPGRNAATFMATKVGQGEQTQSNLIDSRAYEVVLKLPAFLVAWGCDFLQQSNSVLDSLYSFFRKIPLSTIPASSILDFQKRLIPILSPRTKQDLERTQPRSIFEDYPDPLKRKFLGLVCILQSPPSQLLSAFASLCARSNISSNGKSTSHDIFAAVQSVKRTIALPQYLAFIINTIGVPGEQARGRSKKSLDDFDVFRNDDKVARASKALVACGSRRSFDMLCKQFSKWLETDKISCSEVAVLRIRAASSLMAMLIRDIELSIDNMTEALVWDKYPELLDSIIAAAAYSLPCISALRARQQQRFLAPIALLLGVSAQAPPRLQHYSTDTIRSNSENAVLLNSLLKALDVDITQTNSLTQ